MGPNKMLSIHYQDTKNKFVDDRVDDSVEFFNDDHPMSLIMMVSTAWKHIPDELGKWKDAEKIENAELRSTVGAKLSVLW